MFESALNTNPITGDQMALRATTWEEALGIR